MKPGVSLVGLVLALAASAVSAQQAQLQPAAFAPRGALAEPAAMPRLRADFRGEKPSADAAHVANWAFFSGDAQGRAVVILDKKAARVFAFDRSGRLIASTPALLGAAIGDHTVPGVGDKALADVLEEEKTTPAGRFVAQPGVNALGEDVVWVDYQAAVSMHRVRPLVAAERRLERLASPTEADNRISFGCINLPVAFYERVLSPTVRAQGAIVYVLPETRTPQQVFGSFDVNDPVAVAAAASRRVAPPPAQVSTAVLEPRRERGE